ncbi:MAG: hypothetical protein ACE5HS_06715 [bacterium]
MVVAQENDGAKVRIINEMYRMKMYVEDAGEFAFAKKMKMPSSIQNEPEKRFLVH